MKKCILCVRTLLTVLQCVCFEWLQHFESMILTLIFYGTAQTLGSSLAQPTFFEFFSSLFLTMFENFQNIRKNFHFCKKMTEKVIFLTFFYFSKKSDFFDFFLHIFDRFHFFKKSHKNKIRWRRNFRFFLKFSQQVKNIHFFLKK